jgi:hypothetical protein
MKAACRVRQERKAAVLNVLAAPIAKVVFAKLGLDDLTH